MPSPIFDLEMKLLMSLPGDPARAAAPPWCSSGVDGRGAKEGADVPAQVCKFLVDSLQSHLEGCVCVVWGCVWETIVSSLVLEAQQTE
jgi:hypothetical protein